jgi:hypothetical protein
MPRYRFVTVWRLQAPIDQVFVQIDDAEAWPTWWPSVRAVELLQTAGPDKIGARDD